MELASLQKRIAAAQGKIDCDLIIKNVVYLDVFQCNWKKGDLAIIDGILVGVEPGLKSKRIVDAKQKRVIPGFIDAHVHLESSLMTPHNFQKAVLAKGTTSAVCDPHELANVLGISGIQYFLDHSKCMDLDLWVMLSSCVPATHMETNGGEISSRALLELASHPKALGLAEMMNMPGVLNSDSEILNKIVGFSNRRIDGHCPMLKGQALSAYISAGISSCHESSELEEAREKLSKGMAVWIREGSVAKDLKTLIPLLNLATSTSIGFCTDDRNPLDIANEGHIDYLVRVAIQNGVAPEVAFRAASWSVARHYGLDAKVNRVGAIAPGYQADLVVLDDVSTCSIHSVIKRGKFVDEIPTHVEGSSLEFFNSIRTSIPNEIELLAPQGNVNVIGILEGKIITEHRVKESKARGIARLSVLERYGRGSKPANAYVEGFGENFQGAIASSVGHDSHNLIVAGSNPSDMRVALASLAQSGGGFCVVQGEKVLAQLDLPLGGLMSNEEPGQLKRKLESLQSASKSVKCELSEPFLQLAFLSLPVIPSLKLTDQGLVDVNQFKFIPVQAS